ncbi:MAG: S-methyl-5-thioribose-1-phosphate isomerase [Bacteroidales bacterium]|nr:S-methyl-5-thioribose-1-phosphate isomerase [Bacteroidales bacterium]MBN2632938.1 S-methyl-5-thioribose-1-phosphate isomerase [Bacteroidales bacterium]
MRVGNEDFQSIWIDGADPHVIKVIDQRMLPFSFRIKELRSVDDVYEAIDNMTVRGAPLIGAAAAFGIYLATLEMTAATNVRDHLQNAARYLISCRPTAVNLSWAVNYSIGKLSEDMSPGSLQEQALKNAVEICETEKEYCRQIGVNGLKVIEDLREKKKGETLNILTHCNAGWLATIDYGTVTAPVYLAHDKGIPVHVWVDETRPRNQGARLTAWELSQYGVPHTLITDNSGGHLMQKKMVDVVFTGSDRTTATGDVANKIGTYLKALAAKDNEIPFYSLFPSTTFDFSIRNGAEEIKIEERDPEEVIFVTGSDGVEIRQVRICPEETKALNHAFDITPARLISGLITERGICRAEENEIKKMFQNKFK